VKTAAGELVKKDQSRDRARLEGVGQPETASADGTTASSRSERLLMQTIVIDGEVILRRLRGFDNPFGYTLQLIDRISSTRRTTSPPDPARTRSRWASRSIAGIGPSRIGSGPLRRGSSPGIPRKRERVPADEVLHLFVRYRRIRRAASPGSRR
jgi:hypothetical protein